MWTDVISIFLKSNCPLCQRPTGKVFCVDCTRQLQHCQLSDRHVRSTTEIPVFAWGIYGGALKRAIAALKYEKKSQIAQPLGFWLADAWLNLPSTSSQPIVIPIPLHATKLRDRGFNQAELLARSFCQMTGLKLRSQGLERTRQTVRQFELPGNEREQNLVGAFHLGSDFRHRRPVRPVLILDDIYTTGATARSAAQTLRQEGIQVFGVVAIAATLKGKG
ncbi:ComF family protein [Chroococcidiopsidales cyanobacterium LEGE 13417]|nr:ComF family protein [Chroococcidiopsidales cyanobacterium LEGE 13417]